VTMFNAQRKEVRMTSRRDGMSRIGLALSLAAGAGIASLATLATAGGSITIQPATGDSLPGLTPEQLERFELGLQAYNTPITQEQGLGPVFNKAGCFSCHTNPLGGWGSISVTRFGTIDKEGTFDPLTEFGGSLFQEFANQGGCEEIIPPFADVIANRLTNSSLAFGLIDAIPDADIAANEDLFDANGDGVRGKVHWVPGFEDRPGSPLRAGRYGWKAQLATTLSFSGDATVMEMGMTNRLFPDPVAPNNDLALLEVCDIGPPHPQDGPDEHGFDFIDRVTDFQRFLAPPPQTPRSGMTGEAIFTQIGCAVCHIPEWQTADDPNLEDAIRNKTIRPYSNFLLHNMGLLGDGISDGQATEFEMRTPTLWNLRTRDPMLHDGRAAGGTFFDRIAGPGGVVWWHGVFGSEAMGSAQAFFNLSLAEQQALVDFLDSLGRREFDADGDNFITFVDFLAFRDCFDGLGPYSPDDPCAIHDINQDGFVDLTDFSYFLQVYTGPMTDCDNDGVPDIQQILLGELVDSNNDGIPDICDQAACAADLNGDSVVNGADLGILLENWGGSGVGDLNGDGIVNGADLGILLENWGACR